MSWFTRFFSSGQPDYWKALKIPAQIILKEHYPDFSQRIEQAMQDGREKVVYDKSTTFSIAPVTQRGYGGDLENYFFSLASNTGKLHKHPIGRCYKNRVFIPTVDKS